MITVIFFLSFALFVILMSVYVNAWLLPLWLILGYAVGLLVAFLALYLQLPLMKRLPYTSRYKFYWTRSAAIFINRIILRLKIEFVGRENIPREGLLTVYANHKSYADPFIILEFMNRPTNFTPKMAIYKLFFVGKWVKYLGSVPIDRSSTRNTARAMVEGIKTVKDGMAMVIFPEGGIKDRNDERMVEMRAGAYKIAFKAKADMLPVRIVGTTRIKKRAPWRSTRIHVKIFPVIPFEEVKDLSTAAMAKLMFERINSER
ncbi:MAG: lysophospholipid acyltransferase family protein [Acholeplasmataceae bacterium]